MYPLTILEQMQSFSNFCYEFEESSPVLKQYFPFAKKPHIFSISTDGKSLALSEKKDDALSKLQDINLLRASKVWIKDKVCWLFHKEANNRINECPSD